MIGAVVLAAGESRRMGAQKLLLPFGGKTVIAHIVDRLLDGPISGVHVVVGRDAALIAMTLAPRPVMIVPNPDYQTGMLSSVRAGLRALPNSCEAALIALGDQPALASAWIDQIVQAFHRFQPGILVPSFQGRRGHPILIARPFFPKILAHYDDVGLRGLLQAHPESILELDLPDPAILSDMDYPEDYRRELARLGPNPPPPPPV